MFNLHVENIDTITASITHAYTVNVNGYELDNALSGRVVEGDAFDNEGIKNDVVKIILKSVTKTLAVVGLDNTTNIELIIKMVKTMVEIEMDSKRLSTSIDYDSLYDDGVIDATISGMIEDFIDRVDELTGYSNVLDFLSITEPEMLEGMHIFCCTGKDDMLAIYKFRSSDE